MMSFRKEKEKKKKKKNCHEKIFFSTPILSNERAHWISIEVISITLLAFDDPLLQRHLCLCVCLSVFSFFFPTNVEKKKKKKRRRRKAVKEDWSKLSFFTISL